MPSATRQGRRPPVIIVGGGLCGLTAAHYLRHGWQLFEAGDRLGGLATSRLREGHRFDQTGHWLHLADAGLRRLVRGLLGDQLLSVARCSGIFSHDVFTAYPFQLNLRGLPEAVGAECLDGFLAAQGRLAKGRARRWERRGSFAEFIDANFGPGIARHFMVPYNQRLWGVHPREITAAWCQRYVPVPTREQVLAGAGGGETPELGYNVEFLYPKRGGIEQLPRALAARLDDGRLHCGAPMEAVDHRRRRVRVGGEWQPYRALVATLPLPELCQRLVAPPQSVIEAAERLRWTAVRYLDVALTQPAGTDLHWAYVPERRFPAYRVGVFSNVAPAMAPRGGSSLYVELASRGSQGVDRVLGRVLPQLEAMGIIDGPGALRFADLRRIKYAYVVFDEHYTRARATLLAFFERHAIYPRGRYGGWQYGGMQDAMAQGREVAKALRRTPAGAR